MGITLTDSTGRRYHFTGNEEELLQSVLIGNIESRRQIVTSIIDFDTRRMKLMADVLAGKKVGKYAAFWEPSDPKYKEAALGEIREEYDESIQHLRAVLGGGLDAEMTAYRAAPAHAPTGRTETQLSVVR